MAQPLVNYETVVNPIGATKTRIGPHVKVVLDTKTYQKGVKVEDRAMRKAMSTLALERPLRRPPQPMERMRAMKQIVFGTIMLGLTIGGRGQVSATEVSGWVVNGPVLTAKDSGTTVALNPDEVLTVKLQGQASTGSNWYPEGLDAELLKLAGREQVSAATLGGQDTQYLYFVGAGEGRATIDLKYRRVWERQKAGAVPTFTATVDVRGAFVGTLRDPSTGVAPPPDGTRAAPGVPASYTYCDASTCTPIKDQGLTCGSCWAFATTGTFEQVQKRADGVTRDLSEQHLVSCNTAGYSCAWGGWQAFPWYHDTADTMGAIGTVYTADYPYTGTDAPCVTGQPHHERLASWTQISTGVVSTATMKQALLDHGPLWVAVCADFAFAGYHGGVFTGSNCSQVNHAVVLTGWDDSTGTWVLRNSWGTGWGESGYMRISYGVNGIGTRASWVAYTGGSTPSCRAIGGTHCEPLGVGGGCPAGYANLGQTSDCNPCCQSPGGGGGQSFCGDDACTTGEDEVTCPHDCPPGSTNTCASQRFYEMAEFETCTAECSDACIRKQDCGGRPCFGGYCWWCPTGGGGQSVCGDHVCTTGEDESNCPGDCPPGSTNTCASQGFYEMNQYDQCVANCGTCRKKQDCGGLPCAGGYCWQCGG